MYPIMVVRFNLQANKFFIERKSLVCCIKGRKEVMKMKMKNTVLTLSATALVLGGLVTFPSAVSAYRGDPGVEGPNCTEERHQDMEQAFENNDYNAWADLMQGKGRVTQVVNEGNFARFAEAHNLAEEGKLDEAKQIRTELGLGLGNGSGNGAGQGNGRGYGRGK